MPNPDERMNGSVNGSVVKPIPIQVYACGACDNQFHILFPDGTVKCARCFALSAFMHKPPEPLPVDHHKRSLRSRNNKTMGQELCSCRSCGNFTFHLRSTGAITCARETCRKSVSAKTFIPGEE